MSDPIVADIGAFILEPARLRTTYSLTPKGREDLGKYKKTMTTMWRQGRCFFFAEEDAMLDTFPCRFSHRKQMFLS